VVLTDRVAVGHLRVYDVVALGRYPHTGWGGRLRHNDHAIVEQCLTNVGGIHLADRAMSELSDGERQRVMIARALAQQPRVLLLDEPSAFLDVRGRLDLTALLLSLTHEHGITVLMSTHDLEHMMRQCDRIWLITETGQVRVGAPEDLGLDGSLQRALAGSATFDPVSGTFVHGCPATGRVRLNAEGALRAWTARALERAGYALEENGQHDVEVTGVSENGRPCWVLTNDGGGHTVNSLGALVDYLGCQRNLE
jgi:iron complex transport system ATP-binding protein